LFLKLRVWRVEGRRLGSDGRRVQRRRSKGGGLSSEEESVVGGAKSLGVR